MSLHATLASSGTTQSSLCHAWKLATFRYLKLPPHAGNSVSGPWGNPAPGKVVRKTDLLSKTEAVFAKEIETFTCIEDLQLIAHMQFANILAIPLWLLSGGIGSSHRYQARGS